MSHSLTTLKSSSKDWLRRTLRRAFRPTSRAGPGIPPGHWGLARDQQAALCLGNVGLLELVQAAGAPLHVVDGRRLRDNAQRFLRVPADAAAGCEVFYSYKTNPVPGVLVELHAAGIGAEVISHFELWLALKLQVPPSKIIYNGPAKSPESIRQAVALGIELINVNHVEELDAVAAVASQLGKRPRVGLRVTLGGWAGQFGTPAAGGQALDAYARALRHPCLDVVGLHVHRGGMLQSQPELDAFMGDVLRFSDALRDRLGLELEVLDVGGSLASPSVRGLTGRELRLNRTFFREIEAPDPTASLGIDAYVTRLLSLVERHYRERGRPMPRVFVEPGRALTSDAQLLLTTVLGLKEAPEQTYAILDAGINLAESCRSEYHQILLANRDTPLRPRPYTLVGPICTPGDTLRWAVHLPELAPGDALAIMDAGAYFVPFSTSFSFPRPAVVMVDAGRVIPLRRAETFDDLLSYDADSSFPGPVTAGSAR